jgi:hypothetical protein
MKETRKPSVAAGANQPAGTSDGCQMIGGVAGTAADVGAHCND